MVAPAGGLKGSVRGVTDGECLAALTEDLVVSPLPLGVLVGQLFADVAPMVEPIGCWNPRLSV